MIQIYSYVNWRATLGSNLDSERARHTLAV